MVTIEQTEAVVVRLSPAERQVAVLIGTMRHNHNEQVKAKATPYGRVEDVLSNTIQSFAAELAFCKHHNVYPDLQANHYRGHDAEMNAVTFDVKWTPHNDGLLMVNKAAIEKKKVIADYFVLVTGGPTEFVIAGYMRDAVLLTRERLCTKFDSPVFLANQSDLIPVLRKEVWRS